MSLRQQSKRKLIEFNSSFNLVIQKLCKFEKKKYPKTYFPFQLNKQLYEVIFSLLSHPKNSTTLRKPMISSKTFTYFVPLFQNNMYLKKNFKKLFLRVKKRVEQFLSWQNPSASHKCSLNKHTEHFQAEEKENIEHGI